MKKRLAALVLTAVVCHCWFGSARADPLDQSHRAMDQANRAMEAQRAHQRFKQAKRQSEQIESEHRSSMIWAPLIGLGLMFGLFIIVKRLKA